MRSIPESPSPNRSPRDLAPVAFDAVTCEPNSGAIGGEEHHAAREHRDAPTEGKLLFTIDDYHRMDEAGLFEGHRRIELIEGEAFRKLTVRMGDVLPLPDRVSLLGFPDEDPMGVEALVEVVCRLREDEPAVPPREELFLGEVLQVEVLLAQELVAQFAHVDLPSGPRGSTTTARDNMVSWASESGRPEISRATSGQSTVYALAASR